MVYPAANHTRFQHALGACHLMNLAIEVLRSKGTEITDEEAEAALIAVLLHDVGHGPFSHALEDTLIVNISHEAISLQLMRELNNEFNERLELAILIFTDQYHKHFLHQLVSGQLDVDRLDYLRRDSFFTGVTEGSVGSDRIIKMLTVVNDQLVVEAKGIYSIEKFLVARRFMYWQVYLHKTVLAAEKLLVNILLRARQLALNEVDLFSTPSFGWFLKSKVDCLVLTDSADPLHDAFIQNFINIDDSDLLACLKVWASHPDKVLSTLCKCFIHRKLYKIELNQQAFDPNRVNQLERDTAKLFDIEDDMVPFFTFTGTVANLAYRPDEHNNIKILFNNGSLTDIAQASDILNLSTLSATITKYFLCYPKELQGKF
jgi:HD superfamily phosphohydrolase